MFERNVFDEYKLYCEQRFMLGQYEGFTVKNNHYFFVPIDMIEEQELTEMIQMASHQSARGDHEVATFIPTATNGLTSFIDGQNCVLFQLPIYYSRSKKEQSLGLQLAKHHQRGKSYPSYPKGKGEKKSWSQFWIQRLSQLEMLYSELSLQPKKLAFDQAFISSFPYYLGRTENAIQYFVDTEIEMKYQIENEQRTICHYQFSKNTWLTIDHSTQAAVKNPVDFIYDYPSRDIAELIRNNNDDIQFIQRMLTDYEKVAPLTITAWRFIYARLLFPIEYFKIIEGYYRSLDDQERDELTGKLFDLFQIERRTEQFLKLFPREIVPKQWHGYIPIVDWLYELKKQ